MYQEEGLMEPLEKVITHSGDEKEDPIHRLMALLHDLVRKQRPRACPGARARSLEQEREKEPVGAGR